MKDDQRKGEGLRSDGGDDGGHSFLLGLVFFSMVVMMVIISLSSVWVWDQSSSHATQMNEEVGPFSFAKTSLCLQLFFLLSLP